MIYSRTMAWVGQLLIAKTKLDESRLFDEVTIATWPEISKCSGSRRIHLPQPRQRLERTESFW